MIIKSAELETVCGITSTLPETTLPEIAFAGKSNVGKSSLINCLLNRKGLARTSSQPGKTQTINFYNINQKLYLVDLPGYGYATAREEIKAQWGVMIENYLHTSKQLTAVFLLIDIRHEPSDNDCLMYHWMVDQGFAPIIIATKSDKVSRGGAAKQVALIRRTLCAKPDTIIIPFSAETGEGKDQVWEVMETQAFGAPLHEETHAEEAMRRSREEYLKSKTAQEETTDQAGKTAAGSKNAAGGNNAAGGKTSENKKERWKKSDKPVAHKTQKKHDAKKAEKHKALGKNPNKRK